MRQVFLNLISNSLKFSRETVPCHIVIKGEVILRKKKLMRLLLLVASIAELP